MTTNTSPRTAAAINRRLHEIGAELAKGRIVPVANAPQLAAEEASFKLAYLAALEREAEDALIAQRVEAAMKVKAAEAREDRIKQAVADATK